MKTNFEYCGKFDRERIELILEGTRLSESNKKQMIAYFVDGVRIKDLGISKQAATSRIVKIIALIEK